VTIVGEPLGEEPLGVTIVGEPLGEEPLGVTIVGEPLGEDFEPAEAYAGSRPGFDAPAPAPAPADDRRDAKGLGYYRDVDAPPPKEKKKTIVGEEPLGEWRHTNETLREWVKRWCSGERVAAGLPHISKWDTSAVTDMSSLFKDQKDFNDDISGWDTGAVTNMGGRLLVQSAHRRLADGQGHEYVGHVRQPPPQERLLVQPTHRRLADRRHVHIT